MASHCHCHHPHHPHPHHHHQPPPPPPATCTHCCCNPSPTCCTTPPPPPQDHHLLQAIASLLSQPHHPTTTIPPTYHYPYHPKSHTFPSQTHQHQHQHQHQTHSTISSLLHRIESLESSLPTHHQHSLSSSSYTLSLRHAAARVIQTHFRSFLARRSRALRHLKHLALIKSSFISLKSSLSQNTHHLDFPSLSLKAVNLLLQLDSIQDSDPMIVDGKRSITRDLVQFLDSIEGVAVKKMHCVKAAKSGRFGHRVNKSRDSAAAGGGGGDDDERRERLQNLRGRVERISRLCKVSEIDEGGIEHEGVHNVVDGGDYDIYDGSDVLISGRNEVFPKKNGVFVQRQGVQPRGKKSVTFAENGKTRVVYSGGGGAYDLDGSTSSDDQGEVLENISCAVEDAVDSSQGDEDDEEALVENGGSPHSSDDGGRNPTRPPKNDGRNIVKGQLQAQGGRILFSAPMPLKMENKAESKSKGVRILT